MTSSGGLGGPCGARDRAAYVAFFAAAARNDHLAGPVRGLLGGVVVGALVDLHPRMPDDVPAPGVFYRHYGRRDVVTFVAGQLCGSACSPK